MQIANIVDPHHLHPFRSPMNRIWPFLPSNDSESSFSVMCVPCRAALLFLLSLLQFYYFPQQLSQGRCRTSSGGPGKGSLLCPLFPTSSCCCCSLTSAAMIPGRKGTWNCTEPCIEVCRRTLKWDKKYFEEGLLHVVAAQRTNCVHLVLVLHENQVAR